MNIKRIILQVATAVLLALPFQTNIHIHAQDIPVIAEIETPLAKSLIGTWILVGKPGEIGEVPAKGGRLKFLTGKNWTITEADPATGVTIFHHGGTYTLDGDAYSETVEYANENTKDLIKQTFKFTLSVDGDTLTQIGIGNPWTEVWKRVK